MSFTVQRTEQFLKILSDSIEQKRMRISDVKYLEGREKNGVWEKFSENGYWGKNDTWFWFCAEFAIPEEYDNKSVKMRLKTGREGQWNALNPQFLVYVNGKAIQALDTNHRTFCLSKEAKTGEKYYIEFEAYSGREHNNISFQDCPLQFELSSYCHNYEAERLYYDLSVAKQAAEMYPENNTYRLRIENYLTNALNLLDCRIPSSQEYFVSVKQATEYMDREFYGKYCGHEDVIADCIGHTHIDVAWLWRTSQTRAKAVRSFATELALMDEYPEHRFSSSQPQLYQYVKEDNPEIYERIKSRIKEGRWEVEGAMWLEADCNLTSGESLIRQILHGKRFMMQEFGVDSKVLWLPDVFGYSAALPQILKKSGVDTFVTSKIHWNDTNHFPYDTFIWKGIDGTEIFVQFITGSEPDAKLGDNENFFSTYNSKMHPLSLAKGWEIYQQKNINNEILVSFGYGDGGGGVTREMIENNRRMRCGIPGTPRSRITTIADAVSRIKKNVAGKNIPKWFGELYLELHRGTYTSMARNKYYNRLSEFLLQSTETALLMKQKLTGEEYSKEELYDSWTTILLNQFHDIIPGSSIKEVYEDSEKEYKELIDRNMTHYDDAVEVLADNCSKDGIFIYNPIGIRRSGIAEFEGRKYYIKDVPAYGWKVINEETDKNTADITVTPSLMENDFFLIKLNEKGNLTRIYDKNNRREVLTEGQCGNVLQAFDDHPWMYDNWELSNYYREKMWEIDNVISIEPAEKTQVSASLKIRRKFLNSEIVQLITIYRDIARIDFDTEADWKEHHIFVKAAFPVDILSDKATYEIQYGAVERPTHMNTSWDAAKFEVCSHKWADYGEPNYGVALINDCKYGYDIHDGVMRLSLIKCGTDPNPEADIGYHRFRYSLMPHGGSWREAGVVNEAYSFNCPLIAKRASGGGNLKEVYSFIQADKPNVIISTVKEACDSEDIIVRMYESCGERTEVTISVGVAVERVVESNLIETEDICDAELTGNSFKCQIKPFEIKTFRLKIRKEQDQSLF